MNHSFCLRSFLFCHFIRVPPQLFHIFIVISSNCPEHISEEQSAAYHYYIYILYIYITYLCGIKNPLIYSISDALNKMSLSLLNFHCFALQAEESRGYQELLAAAKRVSSVPVALCVVKDVWAEYSISSDTLVLFRKVHHNSSEFW